MENYKKNLYYYPITTHCVYDKFNDFDNNHLKNLLNIISN